MDDAAGNGELFMAEWLETLAPPAADGLELLGITIILVAAVWAMVASVRALLRPGSGRSAPKAFRETLAPGILMGLEALVAADIIQTVAIDLTLHSVAVLAVIVLVRTLLSFTMELEVSGRWPWQESGDKKGRKGGTQT